MNFRSEWPLDKNSGARLRNYPLRTKDPRINVRINREGDFGNRVRPINGRFADTSIHKIGA